MINCPKCASEALVETPVLGNIPLDVCPGCSGILFDKDELEALIRQSPDGAAADFSLISPRPGALVCPRCSNKMSRGGLVNPLLIVDKCADCGAVWLDAKELGLVRKLLGIAGAEHEVKVDRPVPVPPAPQTRSFKSAALRFAAAGGAMIGFIGVSYQMYLYFSPAASVSQAPSAGLAAGSALLFAGGLFALNRGAR